MEKQAARAETEKVNLAEQRSSLASMLLQLLDEKAKREEELKKRLIEMEEQREDSVKQYWSVENDVKRLRDDRVRHCERNARAAERQWNSDGQ